MREDPVNFSSDDNAPLFHTVIASQYNVNNIINDDNITDVSDESIEHNEGSRTRITASLCDPSHCLHRYSLLFFMCFLGFGSYFCFDNPGALQEQIINDMDITTSQFAQLYSWYSWPNVILSFCGGFLIDKVFGIRLGAIIFSLCILGGQVVFALGGLVDKFWVMEAGRFIFGIGGESLAVAQNTYAVSWFKGKELSMVFGLQLSFARVGSSVNFAVMFPIYELVSKSYEGYKCLGIVLFIASASCILSQISAFILGFFDWRAEKILNRAAGKTGEVVVLKDVLQFPASFWLISLICVTYYVAIFPFIGLGSVFFMRKFEFSPTMANNINGIVYIVSAGASPVLGLLIDKTGRHLTWVFVSVILTLGMHALLAFSFLNPWIAMVIMGFAYSMLASGLWPMVALIIPEHQLGTAYGIMQSVQNLGLGVITILAGLIVDKKGYLVLETFFLGWLCCSLLSVVVLYIIDSKNNGDLDLSVSKRIEREQHRNFQKVMTAPLLQ